MSNEITDKMAFEILEKLVLGYEKKITLDQNLITSMPTITSFVPVQEFMKAVLREFESLHTALRDLSMLLYATRSNDVKKFEQVKENVDRGEPYIRHFENLLDYERQQADGEKL